MRKSIAALLIISGCTMPRGAAPPAAAPTITAQTSGTTALLIAVSPVSDNVAWVSGASGTWLRTVNGGTTWQTGRVPGADSLQFRDVHAVDANTAFVLSIGNGPQSRIYKTTNAGGSWTLQFTNPDSAGFYDCMDFWDAQRGVVIGDAIGRQLAILTTTDGGAHWNRVPPATLPAAEVGEGSFAASGTCIEVAPGGHAWVVANIPTLSRLLHSADYGRTWSVDTLAITTHEGSGAQSVSFRDARNGVIFGGGYQAQPGDALVLRTTDGGRTWLGGKRMPMSSGAWGGVYVPRSDPPIMVVAGPAGSAYSLDEARTWMPIDTVNYWSLGFASPRAGWMVGQRGRITKVEFR
jgi:photosystem II stability/assembly factor-like uncharacterized protein